ncbi:MAG: glycosyltransferase family 2 protein [Candidatus Woesearchaeota archaeon]
MNFIKNIPLIITFFFLLIILSYYILIFVRVKKQEKEKDFRSISIIIPAHNEEKYISECLNSVLSANFQGKKEIIVVDDGSNDKTSEIVKKFKKKGVILLRTKHIGKSAVINTALKIAKGELIGIVDADSIIEKNSLMEMHSVISKKDVVGVTGVIKVKNRKKHILMWVHIEQLYNSLLRYLLSKINANVSTPGPLSVYRKKALIEVGGFSTEGFSEDLDITIRLIRKGYKISFAEKALVETYMPEDSKGFFRQRTRFARGMLNIFKRHLRINKTIIDIYTLPIFLFTYIQAIVMGSFALYQIISGYFAYFVSQGAYFNSSVLGFFFEWFSIIGFIKWAVGIFTGVTPLTAINIIGIISTLLSYPLYFLAIAKYDKKFDIWHLIPIFFMFPFWLMIMLIYILMFPEFFKKKQYNIWKKNE